MDISLNVQTKKIPLKLRRKFIPVSLFGIRQFSITKIVHVILNCEEIINISFVRLETGKEGDKYLIAHQIEIIRSWQVTNNQECELSLPFGIN